MTAPFQGPIPWQDFVTWENDEGNLVARVGPFALVVFYMDDAHDASPRAAWHYEVRFDGLVASHGFSMRGDDDGARACQRTAVKMAAFHGMELPPEVAPRVAHLLADMLGKGARRVAIDGHHPKTLRAQAEKD